VAELTLSQTKPPYFYEISFWRTYCHLSGLCFEEVDEFARKSPAFQKEVLINDAILAIEFVSAVSLHFFCSE